MIKPKAREANIQVLCTELEIEKIKQLADIKGLTMSHVVRESVKRILEAHEELINA